MDPKENLRELRRLAKEVLGDCDKGTAPLDFDDVARVCELFIALDDWISRGGFLPPQWKR